MFGRRTLRDFPIKKREIFFIKIILFIIYFLWKLFHYISIYKSLRKVLRYQKNCVYLAEVQQNIFNEPSMKSKLRKLSKCLRKIMKHNRTNTSVLSAMTENPFCFSVPAHTICCTRMLSAFSFFMSPIFNNNDLVNFRWFVIFSI